MRGDMPNSDTCGRACSHRRGNVLIEFTLLLPILVSLFLGVVFFGYDYYLYNRLEEAVRMGARFASRQHYDLAVEPNPTCTSCTQVLSSTSAFATQVANFTVYGDRNPPSGSTPIIENMTPANVVVSVDFVDGELRRPAWVRVAITNYNVATPFGTVTLNKPVTVFPYVYKPKP